MLGQGHRFSLEPVGAAAVVDVRVRSGSWILLQELYQVTVSYLKLGETS
jgi:hypothetical protein